VIVFALSSIFYFLVLRAHTLGAAGGLYVRGLMWCPALAAFATLKLNGRKTERPRLEMAATSYAVPSWFIPLLYATIAYVIVCPWD